MQQPLVTVVTPSYNQGRYIRATIESVLAQEYPGIEYIVMDGGSTDETASVAKDYASRLTFISEKDRGQSHAINKGFQMGRGTVMSWLNSDDYYLPGAISAAVGGLTRNPTVGAVYGEGYLIDHDGQVSSRFPHTQQINLWKLVHLSDYILQQTVFFRRDVLKELGYLNEDLHYTMDWDILIRIATTHGLAYVPEYMACLREHPEAKSSAGGTRRLRELHRLLQRHSGRRLPPGSIVYGFGAYQQTLCDWLEKRSGSRLKALSRPIQRAIRFTADFFVGYTLEHAQGLYADGWAADSLRYLLPPGDGCVVIKGHVPVEAHRLRGQTLRIYVNRNLLGKFPVGHGNFRLVLDPQREAGKKLLSLELIASRHVSAAHLGLSGSRRRLAYRLDGIEWSSLPAHTSAAGLPATHVGSP